MIYADTYMRKKRVGNLRTALDGIVLVVVVILFNIVAALASALIRGLSAALTLMLLL